MRFIYDFLSLKNDVLNLQKELGKKTLIFFAGVWKVTGERPVSGAGSVPICHGSGTLQIVLGTVGIFILPLVS
jgi:hypothetical protein